MSAVRPHTPAPATPSAVPLTSSHLHSTPSLHHVPQRQTTTRGSTQRQTQWCGANNLPMRSPLDLLVPFLRCCRTHCWKQSTSCCWQLRQVKSKQDTATLRSKAPRRRRGRHASTRQAHRHRYRPLGHTNPAASKLSIPKVEKSDVAIFDPIVSFEAINHNGECRGRDQGSTRWKLVGETASTESIVLHSCNLPSTATSGEGIDP